jgi:hypothetical protein
MVFAKKKKSNPEVVGGNLQTQRTKSALSHELVIGFYLLLLPQGFLDLIYVPNE